MFSHKLSVADLGEGPGAYPLFWVKKKEMTEGRKASEAGKLTPPRISSRSGSASGYVLLRATCFSAPTAILLIM